MRNHVFVAARDAVSPAEVQEEVIIFPIKKREYFKAIFRVALSIAVIASAALFIEGMMHKSPYTFFQIAVFGMGYFLGCGLILPLCIFAASRLSVGVHQQGITGFNLAGDQVTLSWGEIETVEHVRVLGCSHLKISSFRRDRTVIWLPCALQYPEGFRAAVAEHASPNNPLRRYLEDESQAAREPLRG